MSDLPLDHSDLSLIPLVSRGPGLVSVHGPGDGMLLKQQKKKWRTGVRLLNRTTDQRLDALR